MHAIFHLVCLALAVFALSRFFPSIVRVRSGGAALVVAIVFSVLNFFLGWFLRAVLFVPSVLTLGLLFALVPFLVNAALLWLTDKLMASFELRGGRGLVLAAAVITAVNWIFAASESGMLRGGRWV
jgi:putative membrane protein